MFRLYTFIVVCLFSALDVYVINQIGDHHEAEVLAMVEEAGGIKEMLEEFGDLQHVVLATVDGDQPRVRPVTLISLDGRFWVTTGT